MTKLRFFATAIIILSLIQLGVSYGMVPSFFVGFWPLLFLIIGIAAFLISDKSAWDRPASEIKKPVKKSATKKNASRKK